MPIDSSATIFFVKAVLWKIWWMLELPGLKTGFERYARIWQCVNVDEFGQTISYTFLRLLQGIVGSFYSCKIGTARFDIVFCKRLAFAWRNVKRLIDQEATMISFIQAFFEDFLTISGYEIFNISNCSYFFFFFHLRVHLAVQSFVER